jgi:hypothetical protein
MHPSPSAIIGQLLAQVLDRRRNDGDEIGLAQVPLRGNVDEIAAGARMEHGGINRAKAPFRRSQARLQQRNHIIRRVFITRRRQPGDLTVQRCESLFEKLRPFRQIGVDCAMALVGLAHGRDRSADRPGRVNATASVRVPSSARKCERWAILTPGCPQRTSAITVAVRDPTPLWAAIEPFSA